VNSSRFWRAAAVQLVIVAIPFAILAIAVPHDFFDDYGFAVGPALWIVCSLVTGRILRLPLPFTLFCAAAGGVASVLVMLVAGHEVGGLVGIAVFAACASGYEGPEAGREPGEPPARGEVAEPAGAQSSIP
jgi:hypothetical protein